MLYQDEAALSDKSGRKRYNNQTYQATIGEVEALTGLQFDDRLFDANPLFFNGESASAAGLATQTPERFEIGARHEVVNDSQTRPVLKDDDIDIYIAAAMVNPEGRDRGAEWVSLLNLGGTTVDVSGWRLEDNNGQCVLGNQPETLIPPGGSYVVSELSTIQLSNQGDVLRLFTADNERVDWVKYGQNQVRAGVPVSFLVPADFLER